MPSVSHILPAEDFKNMGVAVDSGYFLLMFTAIGVFIAYWMNTESPARTRMVRLLLVSVLEFFILLFMLVVDRFFVVFLSVRAIVCVVRVLDCCEARRSGSLDGYACACFVFSCFSSMSVAFDYHAEAANFISFFTSVFSAMDAISQLSAPTKFPISLRQ